MKPSIARTVAIVAECLGNTLSETACLMMASELEVYPLDEVFGVLKDCQRSLKGRLTLAAILERLQSADGHPEPDEAWIIALAAENPSNRQPTTELIRQAFKFVKPALDFGDKFGARAGFIERYKRLLADARAQHEPADWLALPEPTINETGQQNALPKPQFDKEQVHNNLKQMRDFIRQIMTQANAQHSEENEKRRAQLRAQAQHFSQLEQESRELKRSSPSNLQN